MEYSIKEVARSVEISEQGLYKRIKTNYADYKEKKYIVIKSVEQPNGTTKEQVFITKLGLEDLLKTKQVRKGATIEDLKELNQVKQPTTKPLNQVEQPNNTTTKPKETEIASNELLKVLNQNILDLKAENKRLNEKLDKQEERFDKKLEEQKKEFKEQYDRQQEAYQQTLNKIMQGFNNALLQLPTPSQKEEATPTDEVIQQDPIQDEIIEQKPIKKEDTITSTDTEGKGFKRLFKRLFKGE